MDRGTNTHNNYNTVRTYLLKEATKRSLPLLPPEYHDKAKDIVEAMIASQYKELNKKTYPLTEMEISGLGRFYFSPSKATKRINKLKLFHQLETQELLSKGLTTSPRLLQLQEDIKNIQAKIDQLNEFKSTTGVLKTNTKRIKEPTENN